MRIHPKVQVKMGVMPEEQDWQTINNISEYQFKQLFVLKADPDGKFNLANACRVVGTISGSFHRCAMIETASHGNFVIRVPAHGTAANWKKKHACALRSEVATMSYIREKTRVPIPKVFSYDTTALNPIQAPYILMEAAKGTPASDVWYDRRSPSDPYSWLRVTSNPAAITTTIRKRDNLLKSLANVMADLGNLTFPKTGRLQKDSSGQLYVTGTEEEPWENDEEGGPSFSSSHQLWQHKISKNAAPSQGSRLFENKRVAHVKQGLKMVLNIISSVPPMAGSRHLDDRAETFVFNHFDLGLQNIFVDSDGHITGIIDWDSCRIVPRCVGFATLPEFLQPNYYYGRLELHGLDRPSVLETMKTFQKRYAYYMVQATTRRYDNKVGDGKFTLNTPIYIGAYMAMIYGWTHCTQRFLQFMIRSIPGLQEYHNMPIEAVIARFGIAASEHQIRQRDAILSALRHGISQLFQPCIANRP